jgi:CDP-glucose 4,6-dehydratase
MILAQKMWDFPTEFCEGWNFGPEPDGVATVWEVAQEVIKNYGCGELMDSSDPNAVYEAKLLLLNINKAKTHLDWKPSMSMQQCIKLVVDWYKRYKDNDVYNLCVEQIAMFVEKKI